MPDPGTTTFNTPDEVLQTVDAMLGASRQEQAFDLVNQALQSGMVHPALLGLRAKWHEQQGRDREALADLERARNLVPQDVTVLNALGQLLTRTGRYAESNAIFDSAIALKGDQPGLHYHKGLALEFLGQTDAARASHERAVALNPKAPRPLARLAMLHATAKQWTAARDAAAKSLAADPMMVNAEFALLEADLAEGSLLEAEARAKTIADDLKQGAHARALAQSYLADALDGQDRTAEAFDSSVAAGRLLREVYRPQLGQPGMESALELVRRLTRYMTAGERWSAGEPAEPNPVFVVGFAYSGAQALRTMFAASSQCVVREYDAINTLAKTFVANEESFAQLAALTPQRQTLLRRSYWQDARPRESEAKTFVDCLQFNVIHLPLIAKLFPTARILLTSRDPRDVVLSALRSRAGANPNTYETFLLDGAARFYDAVMTLTELYLKKLPLDVLRVRCEELPAGGAKQACTFAGVSWNDAMNSAVAAAEDTKSQWRRYAPQLAPVMPVLKPWIEQLGYPQE